MMKHAVALCLFSSTFALVASPALAEKPHRADKARHADKAHRADKGHHRKAHKLSHDRTNELRIVAEPASADMSSGSPRAARPSFWMAADPHVPLAVVDGKQIRGVGTRGKDCGSVNRWARPKSRWHAVDAWGKLTGSFEVAGSESYDVTSCREVSFAPVAGKHVARPGTGLFVSDDSGYKPGESASFAPSVMEKKRFERFLNAVEGAFVGSKPRGKYVPWGNRTMFFEVPLTKDARWEGRVDGAGKPLARPKRWAVSGGPVLTVAYLGQGGQWHAAKVLNPLGLADSYKPVAVFDMNGDGVPEIVYQTSDGATFADAVMSLDPSQMRWEEAAESPGGGAL